MRASAPPGLPARISVKVVPNSSRDAISGWLGDDLKVRIQAPPEDGRANARLCRYLAGVLSVPKDAVAVVAGHGNARKLLEVAGLSPDEIRRRVEREI